MNDKFEITVFMDIEQIGDRTWYRVQNGATGDFSATREIEQAKNTAAAYVRSQMDKAGRAYHMGRSLQ